MTNDPQISKPSIIKTAVQLTAAQAALVLLAIALPSRVRLIVLFAVGLGIASGWVTQVIIERLYDRHFGTRQLLIASMLSLFAALGMHAGLYYQYAHAIKVSHTTDPQANLINNMSAERTPAIQSAMQQAVEERRQVIRKLQSIPNYVTFRVKVLGLDQPWPTLLLGFECIAAALAAAFMNRVTMTVSAQAASDSNTVTKSDES